MQHLHFKGFLTIYMHQSGGKFLNLLQKEGLPRKGGFSQQSRVSHSEGGATLHPTIFFKKKKLSCPPMGCTLLFKMKPPHLKSHPPPPILKCEAPFHEMIPRKRTIIIT